MVRELVEPLDAPVRTLYHTVRELVAPAAPSSVSFAELKWMSPRFGACLSPI